MADDINFLQGIPIPQLGGGFAQQFTDFCNAVKNNFERLISIQYTKGNDGNSVEAKELIIDNNLKVTDTLSVLGYGLVSTIFGDGAFKGDNFGPEEDYHDGLNNPWQGIHTKQWVLDRLENPDEDPSITPLAPVFTFEYEEDRGGHSALPQIINRPITDPSNPGFKVNVVVDEHNGKAYLAVPYVFIDGRIEDLNRYIKNHANADDIYKNFYDFSTVVYGTAEYNGVPALPDGTPDIKNWKWTLWRNDLVPKLYFDENVNEFCWQVNGQQTGVTAQGIKGDDGYTPQSLMALGSRNGDTITIQKLQVIDEQGVVGYVPRNNIQEPVVDNTSNIDVVTLVWKEDPTNPNNSVVIRNIDFVLVFYEAANHTDEDTGNTPSNFAFLGRPVIANDGSVTVHCESNAKDDVFDAIDKQVLRNYLNNIYNWNNGGTHYADLRGLYIPACQPTNDTTIRDKAHMTYSERDLDTPNGQNHDAWTKLRTSPVLMDKTHSSQTDKPWDESGSHVGDWRVDYNLKVTGGLDVGGSLSVQGNVNTQGNLGVQGNTIIQGGLTVGGDTYLGGNITVQGQLTAQGASFRPIKDTHMAVISKFKDTRCEISRSVQHGSGISRITIPDPKGVIYNTKLATTLNIKVGRLSRIQGLQGAGSVLAWDSNKNINTVLHNEIAMYGSSVGTQGMWYDGEQGTPGAIKSIAEKITQPVEIHNAPKLYDVIEYNIPITLAKILETYVDCTCRKNMPEEHKYSVQYDVLNNEKSRRYPSNSSDNNNTICEGLGNGDSFNTPTFRFQEYGVQETNPSDNLKTIVWDSSVQHVAQGAVSALKNKFVGFDGNFHGVQGDLDYMGTSIHYNIDFYIRIFEAASVQQAASSACGVNTTVTIVPVGYISFVEPTDGYTYRAPIYGGVSVKNYLPSTASNILFAKVSSNSSFRSIVTN